jgi:hypothetical protein
MFPINKNTIKPLNQRSLSLPRLPNEPPRQCSNNYSITMQTFPDCKFSMSWLPWMSYNALDGDIHGSYFSSTHHHRCCRLRLEFDTTTATLPPLNFHTTTILLLGHLHIPVPPFFTICITPRRLFGWLDTQSGQVELTYDALFTLQLTGKPQLGNNNSDDSSGQSSSLPTYLPPPLVV